MKILHVITGLSRGGAEHMLYKLLRNSDRQQFEPVVVSMISGGVNAKKIAALGVPVYSLGMTAGIPTPLALWRLIRLVRRINPDIIHGWLYHAGLLSLLSAGGRPVILGIRSALSNLDQEKFMTKQVIAGLGHLSRRAVRICYNSTISRQQHEATGYAGGHSLVIANGFDSAFFQPVPEKRMVLRASLGLPADAFVIGHLGRYHPVKDHLNLLTAFARLSGDVQNAHLVMAGSEVDNKNKTLFDMVTLNRLNGRVHLLGEWDNISELIQGFDILANSSRSEAFPNVLGEAMACAVPCIATDVGDSALIIGDTGIVVPPRDPKALANAIMKMANMDTTERAAMGIRARKRIMENFSLNSIATDYASLYESVLTKMR